MNRKSSFLVFLMAILVCLSLYGCAEEETPTPTESTAPTVKVELDDQSQPMDLGRGLRVVSVGKYAGIYLEDGSNEPVSGLMMVVLRNDSTQDLQLARFSMTFGDKTAEFEASNLPTGESLVVLEKNRLAYTDAPCDGASLDNVAFFAEDMSLCEDQVEITGKQGNLSVKNLSDKPLGEVYVYYKYTAPECLYGGITYRAKFDAGLEPGAMASVMSGHYNPNNTRIVHVQIVSGETD